MSLFKFDSSLHSIWPNRFEISLDDHTECIRQQLAEAESQKREHPYYPLHATIMSHISNMYSKNGSSIRCESSLASELLVEFELTNEQMALIKDPDFVDIRDLTDEEDPKDDDLSSRDVRFGRELRVTSAQLHEGSQSGLDGPAWDKKTSKENRAAAMRMKMKPPTETLQKMHRKPKDHTSRSSASIISDKSQNIPAAGGGRLSPSITSSTTSSARKVYSVVRISDGMYRARAKMSRSLSQDDKATREALPFLSLEVKVPGNKVSEGGVRPGEDSDNSDDSDDSDDHDDHSDSEYSSSEEDREGTDWVEHRDSKIFSITEAQATVTLTEALPQIVQHAQFIFAKWEALRVVWAMAACGRFCRIYKFRREATPEIDYVAISQKRYYTGTVIASLIPELVYMPKSEADDGAEGGEGEGETPMSSQSSMFPIINEDGTYTEDFKARWRKIMVEVAEEFNRIYGGDDGGDI